MDRPCPEVYKNWCHTLFVPMAVCPKCCTNLYQEPEKVPSLENASTTPMGGCNLKLTVQNCLTLFDELGTKGKDFSVKVMVESLEQFFAK